MESVNNLEQREDNVISEEHRRTYAGDGFTVIRSLFDDDEINLLKTCAERICRRQR